MSTPIQQTSPSVQPPRSSSQGNQPQLPVSGGVASTPTTLAPASTEQTPEPPQQRAYFYRCVVWIRDSIACFFAAIFEWCAKLFCCKKESASASPSETPPSAVPPNPAPQPVEFHLIDRLQENVQLLEAFGKYPPETQKQIYQWIGKTERAKFWLPSFKSDEAIGERAVQDNPQLLKACFVRDGGATSSG